MPSADRKVDIMPGGGAGGRFRDAITRRFVDRAERAFLCICASRSAGFIKENQE
jgi:hypothetical protein